MTVGLQLSAGLCVQEGDQRWISTVAQALHLLSTLYGPFPHCYGMGRCAKVRAPSVPTRSRVGESQSPLHLTESATGPCQGLRLMGAVVGPADGA